MSETIPIQLLRPGQTALVCELLGDDASVHRLQEMGLRTGRAVEMVSPGCPCIVRVDGQRLCLRADRRLCVLVSLQVTA